MHLCWMLLNVHTVCIMMLLREKCHQTTIHQVLNQERNNLIHFEFTGCLKLLCEVYGYTYLFFNHFCKGEQLPQLHVCFCDKQSLSICDTGHMLQCFGSSDLLLCSNSRNDVSPRTSAERIHCRSTGRRVSVHD